MNIDSSGAARTARRNCDNGFVLPLVLWIVAALGLVIAAVDTWVNLAVSNAVALRDKTDSHLAMSDVRNELVYLIASRPMSNRGLEIGTDLTLPDPTDVDVIMAGTYSSNRAIAFDGRPFRSETHPSITFRLYDGRGLLNLNDLNPGRIDAMLRFFGYGEAARSRLIDTLRDYIDEDDLTRLSGAEARAYITVNRAPPPNEMLMTPYHALDIIGWREATKLWETDWTSPLLTTCQSTGFNPNTAPEIVLVAALPRVTLDGAREIVARRRTVSLRNQRETSAAAGVTLFEEPFFYSFTPGLCTVIEMTDEKTSDRIRLSLTMLPFSKTQPWRHDYELRLPVLDRTADVGTLEPDTFPAPESVAAREGLNRVSTRRK